MGTNDIKNVSERVIKIANHLDRLKFITRVQAIKTFWAQNKTDAKKQLNKLEDFGIIIRHSLENKNRDMPFYTLGPAGAKLIDKPYKPNWWLNTDVETVLKQLITNQLYLRIYRTSDNCQILRAPSPLSGVIVIGDAEFPLLVVRSNIEDMAREIRWLELKKALVICENYKQIKELAGSANFPVRFTTDYELCNVPLNRAFFRWNKETETLEKETINIFQSTA
jgi:hypothetical protein